MVDIFASVAAWDFRRGVETLLRGFDEAIAALDRLIDQKSTDLVDYEEGLSNGAEPIGEWDDDGSLLWDESHRLQMEIDELDGARLALRKAIVIQLYHLWEGSARRRTGGKQRHDHKELVSRLRRGGEPVADRLDAVMLLANTLKHGNPEKGEALAKEWPEIVSQTMPFFDWYERIVLTDLQVHEVAEIVMDSGPRLRIRVGSPDQAQEPL